MASAPAKQIPEAPAKQALADPAPTAASSSSEEPTAELERSRSQGVERLIYQATLDVANADPDAAAQRLVLWAQRRGGYLVRRQDESLSFRVPSDQFDEALAEAEGTGELLHKNVEVQDVTEQYYDLEARLEAARSLHARLTTLLERSSTVKDTLEIERELNRVAGELEVLEGKLRRLKELVAYSTITVQWSTLEADAPLTSSRLPFSWIGTLGLARLTQLEEQ
jgi:hypothetical protein